MGRPLLFEIIERPATSFVITVCTFVWAFIQRKNIGYSDIGLSYKSVVSEGQHWRILASSVSHISFVHLIFNMSALWSLGIVENSKELGFGSVLYLKYSLLLFVLSNFFVLTIYHVLIVRFRVEYYERVFGVGYSCVVFGWMTLLSVKQPSFRINLFGMFSLPISFAPFESLILTAMIVPQSSFLGHLSGIIAGYFIAWDSFQDLNGYWTMVLLSWIILGSVLSLKQSSGLNMPFLEIETISHSGLSTFQEESNGSGSGTLNSIRIDSAPGPGSDRRA